MKESALQFDCKRHLLYSKAARKVILTRLNADYPPAEAQTLWDRTQTLYLSFLTDLPDLGGRHNPQAQSVYDCIALFAYYEAVPDKPSLSDFQTVVETLFTYPKSPANFNWPFAPRLANFIFSHLAKIGNKHRADWPGNYVMETEPYNPDLGPRYRFTRCPIAEFARTHGYQHLMPAMCNPDYSTLAPIHATLIRTTTCANGPCCDYWLVGDRSRHAKEHPLKTDEAGFWYNE